MLPDELGRLGLPLHATFFEDRDHLGVGHEVPKAFLIPVSFSRHRNAVGMAIDSPPTSPTQYLRAKGTVAS